MAESNLKYGQLFLIYGEFEGANNRTSGQLSTTGFTDNRIFFQSTPFDFSEDG
jgi:hypothetical protein